MIELGELIEELAREKRLAVHQRKRVFESYQALLKRHRTQKAQIKLELKRLGIKIEAGSELARLLRVFPRS